MKNRIHQIVDETLARMQADNALIGSLSMIPAEMLDKMNPDSGNWKPIPSIVTAEDLDQLEGKIGLKLAPSFRDFLQYKHFDACLSATLPVSQISFHFEWTSRES
jgi:hypothetical protein